MKKSNYYIHPIVEQIKVHYGPLVEFPQENITVAEHLDQIAQRLLYGLQVKVKALHSEINNYHPQYLGKGIELLSQRAWHIEDCRQCIASEYGFGSWDRLIREGQIMYDPDFEQAVTAILQGDEEMLLMLLNRRPELVDKRSTYGHQATLLHYTAASGVEFWRQQTPYNLPDIVKILIENGADPDATMDVYGGQFDTLALITTSAHPKEAGVLDDCVRILKAS